MRSTRGPLLAFAVAGSGEQQLRPVAAGAAKERVAKAVEAAASGGWEFRNAYRRQLLALSRRIRLLGPFAEELREARRVGGMARRRSKRWRRSPRRWRRRSSCSGLAATGAGSSWSNTLLRMEAEAETSFDKQVAVVTGGNRGIGFEICRQLASNGITVVLTARDEKRGIEAISALGMHGLSNIVFHQLNVGDRSSAARLADFVRQKFGKLDILVNNAGIGCTVTEDKDPESLQREVNRLA